MKSILFSVQELVGFADHFCFRGDSLFFFHGREIFFFEAKAPFIQPMQQCGSGDVCQVETEISQLLDGLTRDGALTFMDESL